MYTIGQVSEMFGLPISTLRYYDKEGFFPIFMVPVNNVQQCLNVSADAVPSTPMELVNKLTEQEVTPFTPDTAFSTRAEQAAQLIPVTVYCSIIALLRLLLFHEFLQSYH